MSHATSHCLALQGVRGHIVDVQADLSIGAVNTSMLGRADLSIREALDRCRAAVSNAGYEWPSTKRVTILLSPANLRKSGPHYDLAIAAAILAAQGKFDKEQLAGTALLGELMLDGALRAVPGVLPMVLAAAAAGLHRAIVPDVQVAEAELVEDIEVIGLRSLAQVVAWFNDEPLPDARPVPSMGSVAGLTWRGEGRTAELDLADVRGMADTRYALEVAAAGGHHLALCGPKGAGKTTLAERVPGLLPDLTLAEALELSSIHSLADNLVPGAPIARRPPFRAPHHSATRASVIGGGAGRTRPGEISQALHGCLFLDEFPLFASDIIEALREPLESGEVTLARGEETATYPARAMYVLAYNPCPCGEYRADTRDHRCVCTESQRRRYRSRLSGPINDRIDILRQIEPVRPHELLDPCAIPEPSAAVRARVVQARMRQAARYADTGWRLNTDVPGPRLREVCPLDVEGMALLEELLARGRLTFRGSTRVHRVAMTIADLDGLEKPGRAEVEVAYQLRTGEPLELRRVQQRVVS